MFLDRHEALVALKESTSDAALSVKRAAIKDSFWAIRGIGLSLSAKDDSMRETVAKMAAEDKHSEVRAAALDQLREVGDKKYLPQIKQALENDPSPFVQAIALEALVEVDPAEAYVFAKKLEDSENSDMLAAVGEIYAGSQDLDKMPFFEAKASKLDGYDAIDFMGNYLYLAVSGGDKSIGRAISFLKEMAVDMGQSPWRRYGATKALSDLRNEYQAAVEASKEEERNRYTLKVNQLTEIVDFIKKTETNSQLLQIYGQM